MQIIRAIVAGQNDPVTLAQYRDRRCKSSQSEIAKSLTGHYKAEHLFALGQALASYDFINTQIRACDGEIEAKYQAFKPQIDLETDPLPETKHKPRRQASHPDFDLRTYLYQISGVDLTLIDGVDALTAQTIIAEIGLDMNAWPTVKHFASWLGLAPHNAITGGKIIRSRTKSTTHRANTALRLAAQSAGRSDSALGGFYRRLRAKLGAPKAITATAHKIARIIYHLLKYREQYVDPGRNYYEQQYQDRLLKTLHRKADKLGMKLVPQSA